MKKEHDVFISRTGTTVLAKVLSKIINSSQAEGNTSVNMSLSTILSILLSTTQCLIFIKTQVI